MTPLVSCICPTYGRFPHHGHLLAEAVESFVRQDYSRKELVILNDAPGQEIVCDVPGVRVVNCDERFATLGEKYNAAVLNADGSLVCPWEDDDISLPWRISQGVERIGRQAYWNPQRYWFLDRRGLHHQHAMGVGHNCSIFTYAAFVACEGYPAVSGAQDAEMDRRLRSKGAAPCGALERNEWSYIYRWGVSPCHLSGNADHQRFYDDWGKRKVPQGRFRIEPGWQQDYAKMVAV